MVTFAGSQLSPEWPPQLEVGCAGEAIAGERRSGDRAVFAPFAGGALVAVIDGLGHGDDAADAADAAAATLERDAGLDLQALVERCHRELRRTRGAVATLARFDLAAGRMEWAGVGNVEARLVRAAEGPGARHGGPVVLGGVIGYQIPRRLRPTTVALAPGDCVAFATDGVHADFAAALVPVLSPQQLAERALAAHRKGSDDALVAVVRWRG